MSAEGNALTLERFLENLLPGDAMSHAGLRLVPLSGNGVATIDYLLASEAIGANVLTVTEVGEGGTVPHLVVSSASEKCILLLDGEELVGAKQNRILNTTVLVAAMARTKIPVSCVEQGRWRHVSRVFQCGGYAPARLRARKSRDVTENLRSHGEAASDQGAVWDAVGATLDAAQADSPTMAMRDAVEHRRDTIDSYLSRLPYPGGARGVAASIGGHLAALDLFDKPDTLAKVWQRLVTGYAMDALALPQAHKDKDALGSAETAQLLAAAARVPCEAFDSVGLGREWRFTSSDLSGQALVVENCLVHMSAFPGDDGLIDGPRREPAIRPPSARRRPRPRPPQ